MKKSHLLIAASALLLASCGGSSNNNNQAQNNASTPETNNNGNATEQTSAPKNADGQVVLSGTIDKNVTWKDLGLPVDYVVEGEIYLDGNSLVTVEPGVTIMFTGTDGRIMVGENAGIKMQGTKDKPIVLTGPTNNPNPGSWDRVCVRSKRADNALEYVTFQNGGAGEYVKTARITPLPITRGRNAPPSAAKATPSRTTAKTSSTSAPITATTTRPTHSPRNPSPTSATKAWIATAA